MLVCNGPVGIDSSKHWFSARGEKRIESFKVTKTQLQRSSNPLDLTFCLHRVFGSFQQPGHVESSGGQVGTAVQDLPTCQHVRFSYHKLAIVAQTYPVHSGHSTLISNHWEVSFALVRIVPGLSCQGLAADQTGHDSTSLAVASPSRKFPKGAEFDKPFKGIQRHPKAKVPKQTMAKPADRILTAPADHERKPNQPRSEVYWAVVR